MHIFRPWLKHLLHFNKIEKKNVRESGKYWQSHMLKQVQQKLLYKAYLVTKNAASVTTSGPTRISGEC